MGRWDAEDDHAIRTVVARVAHRIDGRDWAGLLSLFADVVRTDYTSLVGGTPGEDSAPVLISAWQRRLEPLDATQHLLGPAEVEVDRDTATARCHVRAYHVCRAAPSGPEWTLAGQYVFGLERAPEGWKVRSMSLELLYQSGNEALLGEARRLRGDRA